MDEFSKGEYGDEEKEKGTNLPHHYHAHDENCEDMGHKLHKMEKDEAEMPTDMNEHTEPGNIKDREEVSPKVHEGEYPGIIRKLR